MILLLSKEALAWASLLWEPQDPMISSLPAFQQAFCKTFVVLGRASSTAEALLWLCQESMTVGPYAVQFRTLTSELVWNNEALTTTFWHGLADPIKDKLAGRTIPSTHKSNCVASN